MLIYLSSALPAWVGAEPRLLALQCGLRRDAHDGVRVPRGLLRSMRLAHSPATWHELEEAQWLIRTPGEGRLCRNSNPIQARILDLLAAPNSRSERTRAADWALRVAGHRAVRRRTASVRLTAVALAAHDGFDGTADAIEADRLARVCALSREALATVLDQLVASGVVTGWRIDTGTGDLHWNLALQLQQRRKTLVHPTC